MDILLSNLRWLRNSTNLSYLYLSSNRISDLSWFRNLTKLSSLRLSSNQIIDLSGLRNITNLYYNLDLSSNQIVDLGALSNLTKLVWLDLSFNQIVDISPLQFLLSLYNLSLSHNNISDIQIISNFTNLIQLRLSFNNIFSVQNASFDQLISLQQVFIDKPLISLFDKRENFRIDRKKAKYIFLISLFLVIEQDLKYHDCEQTLDFIQRNIHLNLFYYDQIDSFFDKCRQMDLQLDF
jgi:Leucine-rich repeat (LRR) protein